jgi:predicted transcriptional regulator
VITRNSQVENRMREMTVRVDEDLHDWLTRQARDEREAAAMIVRRALRRERAGVTTIEHR